MGMRIHRLRARVAGLGAGFLVGCLAERSAAISTTARRIAMITVGISHRRPAAVVVYSRKVIRPPTREATLIHRASTQGAKGLVEILVAAGVGIWAAVVEIPVVAGDRGEISSRIFNAAIVNGFFLSLEGRGRGVRGELLMACY